MPLTLLQLLVVIREFIGDNPLFTSAIRLLIAQRLVRRLDENTKKEVQLPEHVAKQIKEQIETLPPGIDKPDLNTAKFYESATTEDSPFGYKGQIAIVELLKMNDKLEQVMLSEDGASANLLRKKAQENGMVTLLQDAAIKAAQGVTSVDEIYRVVG